MRDIAFEECIGFEWDHGNQDKNWEKHEVSCRECEEVFFNEPLVVFADEKHSRIEKRLYLLGQTDAGRRLFIAFTIRKAHIRIISARDMSRKEHKIYEQN